jgi:hypothetical protein
MKAKKKKQSEPERENNFMDAKTNDRSVRNKNQQNLCNFEVTKSVNPFSKTLIVNSQNGK